MEKKAYGEPSVQIERFDDVIVASGGITGTETETPGGGSTEGPGYGGDGDGSDMD